MLPKLLAASAPALLLAALLSTSAARAQILPQPDSTHALPEVAVSSYQALAPTPVTFLNLGGAELQRRNVGQEPSFLLQETPGITAYSDAGSYQGYSYYRLRGIDQTRLNLTLDGVPLNEPEDQGGYFSNYPDLLNSLRQIQIQRGVGTSQNGTASYAGSIQLLGPLAGAALPDSARSTLGLGYGSFGSGRTFGEYQGADRQGRTLYVRASGVHSDGYKYHSANTGGSALLSLGLLGRPRSRWQLTVLAGQQRNHLAWLGVADSLLAHDPRTNANGPELDRFTQGLAYLQHRWQPSARTEISTTLYGSLLRGGYDFDFQAFLGLPSTTELYRYDFRSEGLGAFSTYTRRTRRLTFVTGLHLSAYRRRHTGSERSLGELYHNTGRKQEASAFAKAEVLVLPRLTLFADVQGRVAAFSYAGSVELPAQSWQFLNPKAGLSFAAAPATTLYYSLGRSSREPTRNDLFQGADDLLADSTGRPLLASPAPETVLDHELGLRHAARRWRLDVNAFYLSFRHEIVLKGKLGPNGLALTDAVARSFRTGLETTLHWQPTTHVHLTTNAAYCYSRIRAADTDFTPILTPQLLLNQEVAYSAGPWLLALAGRYQSRSFIDFANSATIGAFGLLNARVQYAQGPWQVSLIGNNLTNQRYYTNGYVEADGTRKRFVQAPANGFLDVQYSF